MARSSATFPVAAADHDRRSSFQLAKELERVIRVLLDGGDLVQVQEAHSRAAATVVDDRATELGELAGGVLPDERRAAGAVDAQDRSTGAALLVVQLYAVD